MTIISTLVSETIESPSGVAGTLIVTSSGSIVNDNGDNGVDTTNVDQMITIDGLVYSSGTGVVDIGDEGMDVYVNGQVQGEAGVGTNDANTVSITVGGQGSIVGMGAGGVVFGGNSDDPATTFNVLTNAGDISSPYQAVLDEYGGGDEISNSGVISGGLAVGFFGNVATETIDNSGTIEAGNGSETISTSDSSAGIDIINSGLLTDDAANAIGGTAVLSFSDDSGTTSTIDNTGSISGAGYVIQSGSDILDITNSHSGTIGGGIRLVSGGDRITNAGGIDGPITFTGSTNTNSLTNSGEITGAVTLSGGYNTVDNSGAIDGEVSMAHSHDTFSNAGTIDGAVALTAGSDMFTNTGAIDGEVVFWSTGTTNTLTNSGNIGGNVTYSAANSSLTNHGLIYGNIILGADDTLINTGRIHGNVTLGSGDTFDVSPGVVTGIINASTVTGSPGDLFEFGGDFGKVTFDDFVAGTGTNHDTIQFAANDFGTFSQVQSASSQVGADVVIKLDATDSITLNNVTLASLVSADFKFV